MTKSTSIRLLSFFILGFTVILVSNYALNSPGFSENPNLMSLAITLDLTLLIPLIYFLIIRKSKISKFTLIPIFILSFIIASFILPKESQFYLQFIEFLLFPLEAFVLIYIVWRVMKIRKAYQGEKQKEDFFLSMREVLSHQFGNKTVANIFTTEISFFYYFFAGWKKKDLNEREYTYHIKNGYTSLFIAFLFVLILETVALHLFLAQYTLVVAWILTGLSIYFVFIMIGDYNAIRQRPFVLDHDKMVINLGIRWYVAIPYEQISKIEYSKSEIKDATHANFVTFGSPNMLIHLNSEHEALGFYGIRKKFTSFSIFVDDKQSFKKEIDGKTKLD